MLRVVIVERASLQDDEFAVAARYPDITFTCANAHSEDEILAAAADCDGLISYGAPLTRRVLSHLQHCQVIVRAGVGYDNVDLDAATDYNIAVVNIPDFCTHEVANHTIMLMLAWVKRLPQLDAAMKLGGWTAAKAKMGPLAPFHHETVGFVGFGRIARMVAERLVPMQMHLLAYDPFQDAASVATGGATKVELEELLHESDYVSVHVPLSTSTRHLLSTAQFQAMKRSAILVNTSRGPVVDEHALIAALQSSQIAGAALDVFEQEPLPYNSPLLTMNNVILTPHTAAVSTTSSYLVRSRVIEEAARMLHGIWPLSTLNRSRITPKQAMRNE